MVNLGKLDFVRSPFFVANLLFGGPKTCSYGCLGLGTCVKKCPFGAIKMENNLAVVDAHVCIEKCTDAKYLAKCPTKAIRPAILGIVPGTESQEAV